jgi:hypothetical protein
VSIESVGDTSVELFGLISFKKKKKKQDRRERSHYIGFNSAAAAGHERTRTQSGQCLFRSSHFSEQKGQSAADRRELFLVLSK